MLPIKTGPPGGSFPARPPVGAENKAAAKTTTARAGKCIFSESNEDRGVVTRESSLAGWNIIRGESYPANPGRNSCAADDAFLVPPVPKQKFYYRRERNSARKCSTSSSRAVSSF